MFHRFNRLGLLATAAVNQPELVPRRTERRLGLDGVLVMRDRGAIVGSRSSQLA